MENKILIIAKNNLNFSFWSQHLNVSNTTIEIIHINDFQYCSKVQNTNLIIMDNYFNNGDSETWMRYQAHFIRSKNYEQRILFLSPHYADEQQLKIVELAKVDKYTFSHEFLEKVNSILTNINHQMPRAKQI